MIGFGIDRLIATPALRQRLGGRRVALLAHPASVGADLSHSLDALAELSDVRLVAAFGPQHGLRGDKQDNMVESPNFQSMGAAANANRVERGARCHGQLPRHPSR